MDDVVRVHVQNGKRDLPRETPKVLLREVALAMLLPLYKLLQVALLSVVHQDVQLLLLYKALVIADEVWVLYAAHDADFFTRALSLRVKTNCLHCVCFTIGARLHSKDRALRTFADLLLNQEVRCAVANVTLRARAQTRRRWRALELLYRVLAR